MCHNTYPFPGCIINAKVAGVFLPYSNSSKDERSPSNPESFSSSFANIFDTPDINAEPQGASYESDDNRFVAAYYWCN